MQKLRDSLGLSQAEFASAFEVTTATVNRWEKNDPAHVISEKDKGLLQSLTVIVSKAKTDQEIADLSKALRGGATVSEVVVNSEIKKLRASLGLTQAEFARALEVSPVTVNRWEKNDPRYKISEKEKGLLEALKKVVVEATTEEKTSEIKKALIATSVAAVVARAATIGLLPAAMVAGLMVIPGLGWMAALTGFGLASLALPFFQKKSKEK